MQSATLLAHLSHQSGEIFHWTYSGLLKLFNCFYLKNRAINSLMLNPQRSSSQSPSSFSRLIRSYEEWFTSWSRYYSSSYSWLFFFELKIQISFVFYKYFLGIQRWEYYVHRYLIINEGYYLLSRSLPYECTQDYPSCLGSF